MISWIVVCYILMWLALRFPTQFAIVVILIAIYASFNPKLRVEA